ncbi:hypothetical protein [Desulfogranum japonicum]|uniref:hypothetical protein n=1 Tax=Desulfogranum japonicum TaxID=231447 RepID=UPI00040E03DD|nr:hypothetical protein [Desulfogranum japonicum]
MNNILTFYKWKKIITKSKLFDFRYYFFTYSDIRLGDIDPVSHYIKYGEKEGRFPNRNFDPKYYRDTYPDVDASELNAFVHYILYGKQQDRFVNHGQYIQNEEELYWYKIISESGMFDVSYYLESNSEVLNASVDPIMHYIKNGVSQKKNPSKSFDTYFYLHFHKDVQASNMNPFVHYILYGKKEGRCCS